MKNFSILIMLLTAFLFSGEVVYKYSFDKPEIKNGKVFLKGCDRSNVAFSPALCLKQVRLLLPDGEKAVSYNIAYGTPVELSGKYDISPVEASGRLSFTPPANLKGKRSDAYSTDAFYPEKLNSKRFFTQYKNGHPVFMTILYPVQYNPVSGILIYYPEIKITVHTESDKTASNVKFNKNIEKHLKALIDNPENIKLTETQKSKDAYDYLIITSNFLTGDFRSFTDFNYRRGLRSKVVSVDSILIEMTGEDDADKIRNYIIQEYTNNDITYVLLAADTHDIPHRGFRSEIMDYGTDYYDETDIPADMYYGCLDGTWQVPRSFYYGEAGSEDLLWEVYVSRFPVDNATDLNNMINKTISYSETPVINEVTNNIFVGELLWEEGGGPGWVDSYGGDCMDELVGYSDHNSYETTGFSNDWSYNQMYDRDLGYWYKSDLITDIKNNDYSWINHLGHSNNTYNMRLTTSDVTNSNFNNNGTDANYFLIYSQGCYSGAFDNRTPTPGSYTIDCIGEEFALLTNGAVAYLGNSRYGLGSPYDTDGSGQRFHRFFHNASYNQDITNLEQMNAYSKEVNAALILEENINLGPYFGQCKWIAYTVNVMGDPALDIWTAQPQIMNINLSDTLSEGASVISEISTDVPLANVAVFFEGVYLYNLETDGTGYTSHIIPAGTGLLEYYITKHNYYQGYGSTFIVPAPDSPVNISTGISGNLMTISWDIVPDANSYIIYSADDPYGTFTPIDTVSTNTWNTIIDSDSKKFYRVVASDQ